uniref:DUF727 domain-containing protein n=1 Tax=Rhabditophanes sp. KR3021 TaxID=114890 RepID=A0AC35TKL6_9BILA
MDTMEKISLPQNITACRRCSLGVAVPRTFGMSLIKLPDMARSFTSGMPTRNESALELEAVFGVQKVAKVVQMISVSDILPRTEAIIFVNLTTIEGKPYCIELTHKGWRITSLRSDCMIGDFTKPELFINYYETLFDVLYEVSPIYRDQYSDQVNQASFEELLNNESDSGVAPSNCHAYGNWSDFNSSASTSSNEFLNDMEATTHRHR